jgi:hypothetical protein
MSRKLPGYALIAALSVASATIFLSSPVWAQGSNLGSTPQNQQTFNPKEITIAKPVPWGNVNPGDTLLHRWQRSGVGKKPDDPQPQLQQKPAQQQKSGWSGWSNFYRSF